MVPRDTLSGAKPELASKTNRSSFAGAACSLHTVSWLFWETPSKQQGNGRGRESTHEVDVGQGQEREISLARISNVLFSFAFLPPTILHHKPVPVCYNYIYLSVTCNRDLGTSAGQVSPKEKQIGGRLIDHLPIGICECVWCDIWSDMV